MKLFYSYVIEVSALKMKLFYSYVIAVSDFKNEVIL